MARPLGAGEIAILEAHVIAGDRIAYYAQLADWGYEYGRLALGVVNNDTLAGATANIYFAQEVYADGGPSPCPPDLMAAVGIGLMEADLDARKASKEVRDRNRLPVDVIHRYHKEVFAKFGIQADAWTPDIPLNQLATVEEREALWDSLLHAGTIPGNADAWAELLLAAGAGNPDYLATLSLVGALALTAPSTDYGPYSVLLANGGSVTGGNYLDNSVVGSAAGDVLMGYDGNDRLYALDGEDRLYGGDGDDLLIGGLGADLIDGGAGKDTARMDGGGHVWFDAATGEALYMPSLFGIAVARIERVDAKDGVKLARPYIEIDTTDFETGNSSVTDKLFSIEFIELTPNPDRLNIDDSMLGLELTIDMGDSRRTQSEIDRFNASLGPDQAELALDDGAFISNVDMADYSGVTHGLVYADGRTAERQQGLLQPAGIAQDGGLAGELALLAGLAGDNLAVQGADRIVLTAFDDVLAKAAYGSIVDLGGGADKVWLQPGVLVERFGGDDRLALFGALNLYGGTRGASWETPWAIGHYGIRYAINGEGDLLVDNPWTAREGRDNALYIHDWQDTVSGDDFHAGVGAGNILLAEIDAHARRLADPRPVAADNIGLMGLLRLHVRQLTGRDTWKTSDPIVLDLDGDGVELAARTPGAARFDGDGDLYAEPMAGARGDDGLLARDIDGDGLIGGGRELFGHGDTYGFALLAGLDGNGDGLIDAGDDGLADFNGDGLIDAADTFAGLLVWQDLNGNFISEPGELKSLADHEITSISLPDADGRIAFDAYGNPLTRETLNGNLVIGETVFARADGSTGTAAEVLFPSTTPIRAMKGRTSRLRTRFRGCRSLPASARCPISAARSAMPPTPPTRPRRMH